MSRFASVQLWRLPGAALDAVDGDTALLVVAHRGRQARLDLPAWPACAGTPAG